MKGIASLRNPILVVLPVVILLGVFLLPAPARESRGDCLDPSALLTPEEERLTRAIGTNPEPVAEQLLRRSGLDRFQEPFEEALCSTDSLFEAFPMVAKHGERLWRAAVDRVQGRGPGGRHLDLPRGDDRPLFWARLKMTRALKQWEPHFNLGGVEREALEWVLERASRGQFDIDFLADRRHDGDDDDDRHHDRYGKRGKRGVVRRMLISGFDPFSLDTLEGRGIRIGNPSGAIILSLDGTVVETPNGKVSLEVAIFPVRWRDFDLGMVEDTFGPYLRPGRRQVHGTMTISQGGSRMDLEQWNGRYHTGNDNNNINPCPRGPTDDVHAPGCLVTPPTRWVPFEAPQWTQSTQPIPTLLAAGTTPFIVFHRTSGSEYVSCTARETVNFLNGPSSLQACARSGGGGSFLSNEIAYRVTLLRDVHGLTIPAGHLHVPVMSVFRTDNLFDITDEVFEAQRDRIVQQARALVHVVAGTLTE
jgi:hypothetical protein